MTDEVPDSLDPEKLQLRCDAGNKLYDDLWRTIRRHTAESAITHWEIVGALEMLKDKFKDVYLYSITKEDEDEHGNYA